MPMVISGRSHMFLFVRPELAVLRNVRGLIRVTASLHMRHPCLTFANLAIRARFRWKNNYIPKNFGHSEQTLKNIRLRLETTADICELSCDLLDIRWITD
jgi:hypothetical protein